jgi:DNA-binding NarL/FixJ family response regulator
MELVTQGLTNREIATRLGVAEATVKTHLTEAFRRLGATNRFQATANYLRGSRGFRDRHQV